MALDISDSPRCGAHRAAHGGPSKPGDDRVLAVAMANIILVEGFSTVFAHDLSDARNWLYPGQNGNELVVACVGTAGSF